MSSRSYNLAFDNPYNQRIADVLKKYDMNRDTNGEPDDLTMYTNSRLVGGSHPHMMHMGIKEEVPYTPLPRPNRSMNPRRRYMDEMMGAGRPPGGVSPYVEPLNPNQLIDSGTMATYPIYNALEMKSVGGCCSCMDKINNVKPNVIVVEKEKKVGGKRKSYGKKVLGDVGKIGKDVGTSVLKDLAKEAIKSAFKPGAKVPTGGKRGRKKRESQMEPEPKPEEMFTEVQQGGMSIVLSDKRSNKQKNDDAKKSQNIVKKTVKKVFGGKVDGRAKRAEIVKKIMKEKGMKMIDASKWVKEHNLY